MRERKPRPAKSQDGKSARRKAIAKGIVAGKSIPQIAQEIGIDRTVAWRQSQEPETQSLIRSWMEPHHNSIKRMIPRALAAVNKGLKPSNEIRDRLNAVKTLGTVMGWAQGETNGSDTGRAGARFAGNFEELLIQYRQITSTTHEA